VQVLGIGVNLVNVPASLASAITLPTLESMRGLLDENLLIAAVTFAFIASAETLLSAAAVDRMHDGERTKYDKELTAQGIGNMLCGALGALPMTGVIVRSAANVQAGSATRAAAMLHGAWLLVLAMLLPWLLNMTPVSCLAGILVFTGIKMVKFRQVKDLAAYGKGTALVYLATMVAIVATDLLVGVIIGFGLSLFRLALLSSKLKADLLEHDEPGHATFNLKGSATFLQVPAMARKLDAMPSNTKVTVDISELSHVDQACLELLKEWERNAPGKGIEVVLDWKQLDERVEGRKAA
jgi:MFS superfamily sulfate permease-like transporter